MLMTRLARLGPVAAFAFLAGCSPNPGDAPAVPPAPPAVQSAPADPAAARTPAAEGTPSTAQSPDASPTAALQPRAAPAAPPAPGAPSVPMAVPNFVALVEQVGPAVVNITTTSRGARAQAAQGRGEDAPEDPLLEFFRRFLPPGVEIPALPGQGDPRQFRQQGIGSGFIVSADGHVLTNAHVVADSDEVTVRLADAKREFKAKVVGIDRRTDVALLKVDASGLPVARIGNSAKVKAGEWVAAIGSPFGFNNTITAGIVSATERALPSETFVPFIQTDVAVNPGNSGGPLINLQGEVIGINSQIYSRTGGYMGVSFAIPIEVAMNVSEQLRTTGKVTRGRIGVTIQPVTEELARSFKLDEPRGVLVAQVEPNGPAAKAGIKPGDIIVSFNGKALANANELPLAVAAMKPGSQVKLEVWRQGARKELTATIGEMAPDVVARAPEESPQKPASNRLGLVLGELSPEGRKALGVDYGLVVREARGPAAAAQIRRGDVIVAINGNPLDSAKQLDEMLAQQPAGSTVALLVRRGEAALFVPVPVG